MASTESVKVPYPAVAVIFGTVFAVMVPLYLVFQASPKGGVSWYLSSPSVNYFYIACFSASIFVLINYALTHSGVDRAGQRLALTVMLGGVAIFCFTASYTIMANRSAFDNAEFVAKDFRVYGAYYETSKSGISYRASLGFKDEYGQNVFVPLNRGAYDYVNSATNSTGKPSLCVRLYEQFSGVYHRIVVERRQYPIDFFSKCESA